MKIEEDLQYFIADNPWLLNPNYERVAELSKADIEFQIGDQKRIDLILRDRISRSPVVVEFKFGPFSRQDVGQILEYKARVAMSFTKEHFALYDIFKEYILVPKLALVVETCDDYSRVACNMAGIDVYEYRNFSKTFNDPEKIVTIKAFTETLKNDRIPLSRDRQDELEKKVYMPVKGILEEHRLLSDAWREPQRSTAYFYPKMANLLLNRWLFAERDVSMGLYEDISPTCDVVIAYFSEDRNLLERFEQSYSQSYNCSLSMKWCEQYSEGYLERPFPRNEFFDEIEAKFKEELKRYLRTLESISLQTRAGSA